MSPDTLVTIIEAVNDPLARLNRQLESVLLTSGWQVNRMFLDTAVFHARCGAEYGLLLPRTNNVTALSLLLSAYGSSLSAKLVNKGLVSMALTRTRITSLLSCAGVPLPQWHIALSPYAILRELPDNCYPVVMKPDDLYGLRPQLVSNANELRYRLARGEIAFSGPCIAEKWCHQHDEHYVKIYQCASQMSCFRKPCDYTGAVQRIAAEPSWRELSRQIGSLLELDCFSVDLIHQGQEYVVIDVNPVPAFWHMPDMWSHLSELLPTKASEDAHSMGEAL